MENTISNSENKVNEQFIKEIEKLYETYNNKKNKNKPTESLKLYTLGENQINKENTFNTFNFLNRIIYINKNITLEMAREIFEIIHFWNTIDKKELSYKKQPIKILINTDGGDLEACFTIISAIKLSKTPVYTCNIGKAKSGGFLILISGHKSFGVPYATYLFHEGSLSGNIDFDAHKFLQLSENYKEDLEQMKTIVTDNTIISPELYEEHKKDDWFFNNETALKYNIIKKVINNFDEIEEEDENE